MPALQVKDFPEELYESLKRCADKNRRSVSQQTIVLVEQGLGAIEPLYQIAGASADASTTIAPTSHDGQRMARIASRKALFAELDTAADDMPKGFPNPAKTVREGRDEREQELDARIAGLSPIAGQA